MNGAWWISVGLFLIGASITLMGLWLKAGPEWTMIIGGFLLLWFSDAGFRAARADSADND